jgi:hypothetical protein
MGHNSCRTHGSATLVSVQNFGWRDIIDGGERRTFYSTGRSWPSRPCSQWKGSSQQENQSPTPGPYQPRCRQFHPPSRKKVPQGMPGTAPQSALQSRVSVRRTPQIWPLQPTPTGPGNGPNRGINLLLASKDRRGLRRMLMAAPSQQSTRAWTPRPWPPKR